MMRVRMVVVTRKVARSIPRVAEWSKEALLGVHFEGWTWAEDVEWRNGTGLAVLATAPEARVVLIPGYCQLFRKIGDRLVVRFPGHGQDGDSLPWFLAG